MKVLPAVCLLFAAVSAQAQSVYKCEEDGRVTYTDRPCSPTAQAHPLPGLIVTAPPTASEKALARAHDERAKRELAERDRADAEWLKRHGEQRDRDERVRNAIIEHRVIKGMTFDEVRQALGDPDQKGGGDSFGSAKDTWTWRDGDGTRVVNFKDGEVTSTSGRRASRDNRQGRAGGKRKH